MIRRSIISGVPEEVVDFEPIKKEGITILKLSKRGDAKEKLFKLSDDLKLLKWDSALFSFKFGRSNYCKIEFNLIVKIEHLYLFFCLVLLENITRVQKGQKTAEFERLKTYFGVADSKSLTIFYRDIGNKDCSLNLICANKQSYKQFNAILRHRIMKIQEEKKNMTLEEQYIQEMWNQADIDHNGKLSKSEIMRILASMNIHMPRSTQEERFRKFDEDSSGQLDYDEFRKFMEVLRDWLVLFSHYFTLGLMFNVLLLSLWVGWRWTLFGWRW